ncbi:hypothetical protein IJG72_02505 [bacterium]|nr:hypothetical protein [bacterium]
MNATNLFSNANQSTYSTSAQSNPILEDAKKRNDEKIAKIKEDQKKHLNGLFDKYVTKREEYYTQRKRAAKAESDFLTLKYQYKNFKNINLDDVEKSKKNYKKEESESDLKLTFYQDATWSYCKVSMMSLA